MSERQEYAEPVAYFAASGSGSKLDRLREQVRKGEREVRDARDWSQRTRREQELRGVRRELEDVENAARQVQQGKQAQQREAAGPPLVVCKASDPGAQLIASACGTRYLAMRPALSATQQAAASPATQFAEPTPYYETAKT